MHQERYATRFGRDRFSELRVTGQLHRERARVLRGEWRQRELDRLHGGQSVAPLRLRCFDCTDYDVDAAGAGGYYTDYWYGRWMRY